jgi:hypothetical protein
MMHRIYYILMITLITILLWPGSEIIRGASSSTTSMKGRIIRSDINQAIPDAVVTLTDEDKSGSNEKPFETKTNANGEYSFEQLPQGKYNIQVKVWFDRPEKIPCHDTLAATTLEKNSSVIIMPDGDRFLHRVLISGFKVKAGKPISKDVDIVCKRQDF